MGSFGYFPTYTLGNLNASQLMRRAMLDCAGLEGELTRGEYQTLLAWLREKIHHKGLRYQPPELMQRATGEPTSSVHHLEYLRAKFTAG
jgi:carboxypeptidase Taq